MTFRVNELILKGTSTGCNARYVAGFLTEAESDLAPIPCTMWGVITDQYMKNFQDIIRI